MALNSMRSPVRELTKRTFTAQAAVQSRETEVQPPDVTCTVLPNKLMVSTLDLNGPLTRVSVAFKVGSRNETYKNAGILHAIRSMTGFGTQKCTAFSIWKNTQHNGVNFYCTGDREITGFHMVGARDRIPIVLKYFAAVVAAPAFKNWEVSDNLPRLRYNIEGLTPQTKVVDKLHAAAFRKGLGNSLFISEDRIGEYSSEMLYNFFQEGFTANNAAVVGYNISHSELLEFAKNLELNANELPAGNSKFFGGEIRSNVNSDFAHVAIATQGVGTKDLKETLTYCILQHAYGIHPVISWGGSPSPIYNAVFAAAPEAGISCINACYSDTGLFGFMLSSFAKSASPAVKEAFKVIKAGSVNEADFNRGKALVKSSVLYNSEKTENLMDDICYQSLHGGVVIPGPVLAEAVDKITLNDVGNAAKKVASGKFAMAAYGNLEYVPYLDELI